ncbi:MAG: calcium/sodium antiporter [Minwuiales bacterium]|nr:calcium/sodium antiporter [Minwuiales bacterium]
MSYVLVAAGLVFLLIGGEVLVRGTVSLAERMGVSKLIIGLTIVSVGTSAPELFVCVKAAISGAPGIALGNVVGSNIANILLVLGLPAVIYPIVCDTRSMRRDGSTMILATVFFLILCWMGALSVLQGAVLLFLLIAFLSYSYRRARRSGAAAVAAATEEIEQHMPQSPWVSLLFIVIGIAALVAGSRFLVDGATEIARSMGVSDEVIGITLIAVGTSLPEVVTGVVAAIRHHGDVAVGNAIGSNLFNILGIMGATAIVAPIPVTDKVLNFDLWIMLLCAVLVIPFALRDKPIGRITGAFFLIAYSMYLSAQFHGMSGVQAMALAG